MSEEMTMSGEMTRSEEIARSQVIEVLGSEWLYDQLRKKGKLKPVRFKTGVPGKPQPLFRRSQVERLKQQIAKQHPGPGWLTVIEALREFPFAKKTLYRWINKSCLALGRRITKCFRNGVVYLSRADLKLCRSFREGVPSKYPGNTGEWISLEIYKNSSGRLLVTRAHIRTRYGIHPSQVTYWIEPPVSVPDGGSLYYESVHRPSLRNPHGGKVVVFAEDDIERIMRWYKGEGMKAWTDDGAYDRGEDGIWVTSRYVQEKYQVSGTFCHYWCSHKHPSLDPAINGGKLRQEEERMPRGGTGGQSKVFVFPLTELQAIFSHRAASQPLAGISDNSKTNKPNGRRESDRNGTAECSEAPVQPGADSEECRYVGPPIDHGHPVHDHVHTDVSRGMLNAAGGGR